MRARWIRIGTSEEFPGGSVVKDLALSLLQCVFDSWTGNFHMSWERQKKKKKKKKRNREKGAGLCKKPSEQKGSLSSSTDAGAKGQ